MKLYDKYFRNGKLKTFYHNIEGEGVKKFTVGFDNRLQLFDGERSIDIMFHGNSNFIKSEMHSVLISNQLILHKEDGPSLIHYDKDQNVIMARYYLNDKAVTKEEHLLYQLNEIIHDYNRGIICRNSTAGLYSITNEYGDILYNIGYDDLENECIDIIDTLKKVI